MKKFLITICILLILVKVSFSEKHSDSLTTEKKFKIGFIIGPKIQYPIASINKDKLVKQYEYQDYHLTMIPNTVYVEVYDFLIKPAFGFSVGLILEKKLSSKLSIQSSPTITFQSGYFILKSKTVTYDSVFYINHNFPNTHESLFEVPVGINIKQFAGNKKLSFGTGLSYKLLIDNNLILSTLSMPGDGDRIYFNSHQLDGYVSVLSNKLFKNNDIEVNVSFSIMDIHHKVKPSETRFDFHISSIHYLGMALLLHIF